MAHDPILSRRAFGTVVAGGIAVLALPRAALALTVDEAKSLIDQVVGEVNSIINSGKSEAGMFPAFENVFASYGDVPAIARSVLGVAARSASAAQMSGFTKAYQGYLSRKYGRRFREFIGGKIEVTDARPYKSYFEVISTATLQGEAPFDLRWWVGEKSGKKLFFNIIIEGINMLASERTEVGALLDQRGGDLDKLIADLKNL